MTGEVKIEKECVKMTHRTFVLLILSIVVAAFGMGRFLMSMESKQDKILATMHIIVGGCCPDDIKKLIPGDALAGK